MRRLLLAAMLSAFLAGAAPISSPRAESGPNQPAAPARTVQPDAFRVIPAARLIGRAVGDVNSQPAGTVEFVLVDSGSGQVRALVIGSGGFLTIGQDLVAVPWQALAQVGQDGSLRVDVARDSLNTAPRITRDRIADLASPAMMTRITDHYAASGGGQGKAPARQQAPGQGRAQDQAAVPPHILVGRGYVTTILPSQAATADGIVGDRVITPAGSEIGHIDELMIDAQSGKVAYALVARGGFLGMGQEWVPVPFAPLAWNPSRQAYVLDTGGKKLTELPGFPRQQDLPVTVSREELAELYQRYGAAPYWQ